MKVGRYLLLILIGGVIGGFIGNVNWSNQYK